MSDTTSPPPIAIDALARALPSLARPLRHERKLHVVYWLFVALCVSGLVMMGVTKTQERPTEWLGWTGFGAFILGGGGLVVMLLAFIAWVLASLPKMPGTLMNRLEETYRLERAMVLSLRAHGSEELASRARFAKLQIQLFDRVVAGAALVTAATAAAAPVIAALLVGKSLADLRQLLTQDLAALALGVAVGAALRQHLAGRLMRIANLYEEAARPSEPANG